MYTSKDSFNIFNAALFFSSFLSWKMYYWENIEYPLSMHKIFFKLRLI